MKSSTFPPRKTCSKCGVSKRRTEFLKKTCSPDGKQGQCKNCQLYPGGKKPPQKPDKEERFSIVRNVHRRTGQCSWGVLDSVRYDGTNPVVYIGSTLKETLLECNRLNAPTEKLKYTKHGQTGYFDPDKETL
jgi:hypothetical protein